MGFNAANSKLIANPWTGLFRPNPQASVTLLCFPYAGGTSLIYRNWPSIVPKAIDICPVNLPGRGARLHEAPFTDLISLVEAATVALEPNLQGRFAFFGHSMGARISFELARLLRKRNATLPLHIFVSGSPAPQIVDSDPPTYMLPEPEFIAELRRLNGTPPEVLEHPELMQLMIPLLRADFQICQTYVCTPGDPLPCPITAFGGLQDMDVPRQNVAAWQEQTSAKFNLRMVPGDHFFLNAHERIIIHSIVRDLLASDSAVHL